MMGIIKQRVLPSSPLKKIVFGPQGQIQKFNKITQQKELKNKCISGIEIQTKSIPESF